MDRVLGLLHPVRDCFSTDRYDPVECIYKCPFPTNGPKDVNIPQTDSSTEIPRKVDYEQENWADNPPAWTPFDKQTQSLQRTIGFLRYSFPQAAYNTQMYSDCRRRCEKIIYDCESERMHAHSDDTSSQYQCSIRDRTVPSLGRRDISRSFIVPETLTPAIGSAVHHIPSYPQECQQQISSEIHHRVRTEESAIHEVSWAGYGLSNPYGETQTLFGQENSPNNLTSKFPANNPNDGVTLKVRIPAGDESSTHKQSLIHDPLSSMQQSISIGDQRNMNSVSPKEEVHDVSGPHLTFRHGYQDNQFGHKMWRFNDNEYNDSDSVLSSSRDSHTSGEIRTSFEFYQDSAGVIPLNDNEESYQQTSSRNRYSSFYSPEVSEHSKTSECNLPSFESSSKNTLTRGYEEQSQKPGVENVPLQAYNKLYESFGLLSAFTQILLPQSMSEKSSTHSFGESLHSSQFEQSFPSLSKAYTRHFAGDYGNQVPEHPQHSSVTDALTASLTTAARTMARTERISEPLSLVAKCDHLEKYEQTSARTLYNTEAKDFCELKSFAGAFKQRRMKLGITQAEVGRALGKLKLGGFGCLSQSTICRFESLTLSHNNMLVLKPILQTWLEQMESRWPTVSNYHKSTEEFSFYSPDGAEPLRVYEASASTFGERGRRRRTSITDPEKRILEAYFRLQPKPSGEELSRISNRIKLKKSVVRVWFCNQRQKQKRLQSKHRYADLSLHSRHPFDSAT
ncbi:unnamed protein product [Calicophoron daubneyi]|uniref:POU domain protein n=1 Tax=Calicophoron daubneyi TaxID=300641 RepID=A0AAV2THL3_CALDB